MTWRIRSLALSACLLVSAAVGSGGPQPRQRPIPRTMPAEVRKHVELLSSRSVDDRFSGIQKLKAMGPKAASAVPLLKDLLLDGERVTLTTKFEGTNYQASGWPTIGRLAADALWNIDDAEFRKLLRARDGRHRRAAVECIAERGVGLEVRKMLLKAVTDREATVRKAAAWGLARCPEADARGALLKALGDTSGDVRMAAAYALGSMGAVDADKKAAAALIRVLGSDRDQRVRSASAGSLGRLGGAGASAALQRARSDRDQYVRYFVASALNASEPKGKRGTRMILTMWRDEQTVPPPPAATAAARPRTEPPPSAGAPAAPAPVGRSTAPAAFRLRGILSGPGGKVAIINGRPVGVGQTIRGAKVVSIGSFRVELERDGRRFSLSR